MPVRLSLPKWPTLHLERECEGVDEAACAPIAGPVLRFMTCLCCLALLGQSGARDLRNDLESRLEAFRSDMNAIIRASSDERDWNDHGAALAETYRRWFPDRSLGALIEGGDSAELTDLFYATFGYLLYADWKPEETKLKRVFESLVENGWADDDVVEYMHRYLLTFRLFDEARAFRRDHPGQELPAPPPIAPLSSSPGEAARTVLRFVNDGSALEQQEIDLRSTARVLVIGHPSCHFSRDAIAAITADAELSKAMRASAIWLADPFSSLTDGVIAGWNREHTAYAYRYVEYKSDWPEVNYWGTPSFYFVNDGRLVKKVVGWPDDSIEERKEALRAGLRDIGAWVGQ